MCNTIFASWDLMRNLASSEVGEQCMYHIYIHWYNIRYEQVYILWKTVWKKERKKCHRNTDALQVINLRVDFFLCIFEFFDANVIDMMCRKYSNTFDKINAKKRMWHVVVCQLLPYVVYHAYTALNDYKYSMATPLN